MLRITMSLLALAAFLLAQDKKEASPFTLKDTTGKEHSLADYDGKVVVLEWTNKNCPYVVRHYEKEALCDRVTSWMDKGVVWLAVDSTQKTKAEDVEAWRQSLKAKHPVLLDPTGEVGRAYRATNTPHFFIVKDGKILYQGAIDDDRDGKKKDRIHYVDQALTEILDGKAVSTATTKAYGCTVKYAPVDAKAKESNQWKSKLGVWITDAEEAKKISKATGKPILMDFTGSDWCGWCIKLKSEVFHKPEFESWAKDNVVLLTLDFPRKTKLEAKLAEQNEALKNQYKIRSFPTIVFTNHEGKEIGRSGYLKGGPEAWIEQAKSVLSKSP